MNLRILLVFSLAAALLAGCQKEDQNQVNPQPEDTKSFKAGVEDPCYEESYVIYGGQTIEVGTLIVANDDDNIFVTYDLTGTDWYLDETHLFVGHVDDLPLNKPGNPKIGHFPFKGNHNLDQIYTFTLSKADFEDCFAVAAHAVVVQLDENGNQIAEETAFADGGTEFPGKRWGWYLSEFCVEECEEVCVSSQGHFLSTLFDAPSKCYSHYDPSIETIGWVIGPVTVEEIPTFVTPICPKIFLWACPTKCSFNYQNNDQTIVTKANIKRIPDGLQIHFVDYELRPGYLLEETYVYVGETPMPLVNGAYSTDPNDFNYKHLNLNGATSDIFDITASGTVYIIVHATFSRTNI